ncbi:MAG TPA: ABC transporter ATP-binding protein [Acidimicrobiia bacterium]|nr:ABC transporter ATP-binding protein [Acidimicrobiia bacterium]
MTVPDRREVIALEHVSVLREGRYLIREVSWRVGPDEHWVVLGPNGAGKTTMLQVASTYLAPTRGTVRLLGRQRGRFDVRELRRLVGYAGTGPAAMVHHDLPALEIVVTGKHAAFVDSRWHDYDESDWERARDRLARLEAGHLADRRYGTLSAGERARVMIARSLVTEPALLLLDEATTGLDLGARERLVTSLSGLVADPDGPAIVLVTHHVEEIPPGFDHIVLLADGGVVADGPIEDTLTAEVLGETFGVDVRLERRDARYHAWR